MKRIINKLLKKKAPANNGASLRITNETVAAHRERIIASGRKFKYPLQYPKHRIVLITTIIVLVSAFGLLSLGGWQLYVQQSTNQFIQRATEVIPVPVANVDGALVRYSDYLTGLRSSLHYLSTKEAINFSSDGGKRQLNYQKRLALDRAIEDEYIAKLAKEQGVNVSQKEVDNFVQKEIKGSNLGVSEAVYQQIIKDYYDWSFDDYKSSVKKQLLRKKLVARIDVDGRKSIQAMYVDVQAGKDFAEVAKQGSEDVLSKVVGGDVGFVGDNTDDPSGLIAAAKILDTGKTSGVIEGVDGFYILKLTELRGSDVRFSKIFVAYKNFDQKIKALKTAKRIKEFIKVPETSNVTSR